MRLWRVVPLPVLLEAVIAVAMAVLAAERKKQRTTR
jgi:hypothetical protein